MLMFMKIVDERLNTLQDWRIGLAKGENERIFTPNILQLTSATSGHKYKIRFCLRVANRSYWWTALS